MSRFGARGAGRMWTRRSTPTGQFAWDASCGHPRVRSSCTHVPACPTCSDRAVVYDPDADTWLPCPDCEEEK